MTEPPSTEAIANEVISLLGTERQVSPFSRRYSPFELGDAYDVVLRVKNLRRARGETAITTGTLTEAMPARSREIWRVHFQGIPLRSLQLGFK